MAWRASQGFRGYSANVRSNGLVPAAMRVLDEFSDVASGVDWPLKPCDARHAMCSSQLHRHTNTLINVFDLKTIVAHT